MPEQQLDRSLTPKRSRAMQRRLALGSHIAHKAPGLDSDLSSSVCVRPKSKQHLKDPVMLNTVRRAQRSVKSRLAILPIHGIHIRALIQKKPAQPPMPVKSRSIQIEILSQGSQLSSL